jgi:DNA helicase-2/ATP-dependent DNA helicase PcrA
MPVLLDDLQVSDTTAETAPAASPKFFSSKLTGSGKGIGLLNETLRPIDTTTNVTYEVVRDIETKRNTTQSDIETTFLPLAPVIRRAIERFSGHVGLAVPAANDRLEIELLGAQGDEWIALFDMTPQALSLYEDSSSKPATRELVIQYRLETFLVKKDADDADRLTTLEKTSAAELRQKGSGVLVAWSTSPIEKAKDLVTEQLARLGLVPCNIDQMDQWLEAYPIYDRIARLAGTWKSLEVADEICEMITAFPDVPSPEQLNVFAAQLRYLETYDIPLDGYRQIHTALTTKFTPNVAKTLAKRNLSLLVNHELTDLESEKANLVRPPQPTTTPALRPELSAQQLAAVSTDDPLVMTQAAAGTGKTSVIMERIKYLEACGVPASDITVLSFTNAAADNVLERNPNVGSMTIARMIMDIYEKNHPTHKISSTDTLVNSLEIFFPSSNVAAELKRLLVAVENKKEGSYTGLNIFVETHFDIVLQMLDIIDQTTLELQIILCYQKIDTMLEPPHVQSKYLIIDEVQDNSIFEFIYLLRYVRKHKQSLYIVGDASQTLYEFRFANPRALNTLEGSGVFETFRLTTNYRSNQEILDFANVILGDLETNRIANLQMQANSLDMPTADSFQEKVKVIYRPAPKISSFLSEDLVPITQNTVIPEYVVPCLERGEQVAFLAYERNAVSAFEEVLKSQFPDRKVASLVSDRPYTSDVFSQYIKHFWNDVTVVAPHQASFAITRGILDNLDKLTRSASNPKTQQAVQAQVAKWWIEVAPAARSWLILLNQGSLSHREFLDRMRTSLLDFEIARNRDKLNLNKVRNNQRKQDNLDAKPDLVVSTIHGAKGLEFDNVVVLFRDDASSMSQVKNRLYYVACTRAMKSEYVLAYGKLKNSPIIASHEAIVNSLTERDKKLAEDAIHAGAFAQTPSDDPTPAPSGEGPVPEAA